MQRRQLRGNDAGAIYDTREAIARAKCQDRGGVGEDGRGNNRG